MKNNVSFILREEYVIPKKGGKPISYLNQILMDKSYKRVLYLVIFYTNLFQWLYHFNPFI